MKIYKRIVIGIDGKTKYEESYEYGGSITECKKGGGGGGGSGAGKIDYPDYMETFHGQMLDDATADSLTYSVVDHVNAAHTTNPFTGITAFNPATIVAEMEGELTNFNTLVETICEEIDWASLLDKASDSADGILGKFVSFTPAAEETIADDVAAFRAIADDEVETTVLPRFQRGMQDINAVQSSAFVIGQGIIEGMAQRDVDRYHGELRREISVQADKINWIQAELKNKMILEGVNQMITYFQVRMKLEEAHLVHFLDAKRIEIVAEKEEVDRQMEFDEAEALWDLEVWQFASNALAAIGGGTVGGGGKASPAQSVLGGAMSGAAMGTMIGGPGAGTLIGAGIGAAASLLL